jgi:hypothetical protein
MAFRYLTPEEHQAAIDRYMPRMDETIRRWLLKREAERDAE